MNSQEPPKISVILIMNDSFKALLESIKSLGRQTVRDRLEIILVDALEDEPIDHSALSEFSQLQTIRVSPDTTFAEAKAAGFRNATSEIVTFTEDHSYPNSVWAEALIEAHRQPWAAVGPAVGNANPINMISWADLFILYGRWVDRVSGTVIDDVPGQGSAYKRGLLMGYGSELGKMLEMETILHWDLQNKGFQLYLEPKAKTYHANATRPYAFFWEHLKVGRQFAAARASSWSPFHRFLYTMAGPLIPIVRLKRIFGEIKRSGHAPDLLPGILLPLIMGLAASTFGEIFGYISTPNN